MILHKKSIVLFLLVCTINCSVQKKGVHNLKHSNWTLVNIEDKYRYDSIPKEDVYEKKSIKFINDSIVYYGLTNSRAKPYTYNLNSDTLNLYTTPDFDDYIKLFLKGDTLILLDYGRHGEVREYFIRHEY